MEHTSTITIKTIRLLALFLLIYFCGSALHAQTPSITISGKLTDTFGKPLSGVLINSSNGKNGTSTDRNGEYNIIVDDNSDMLVFSNRHYTTQKIAIGDKVNINIQLLRDIYGRDDVIELGYTSQLRKEISGAISSITGEELESTPVANFTQTLCGLQG